MVEAAESALQGPWSRELKEILDELNVSPESGLSGTEVSGRRREHGYNRLRELRKKNAWLILADQFKSLIIGLLAVAAGFAFVFGDWMEGMAIAAVIFINAAIGFFTELRAVRSMEALQQLGSVNARVRREGEVREVSAEQLVPGDIVILEGGDVVTADVRLIEASKLQADESALTGESVPVTKRAPSLDGEVPLAERTNMLFKGTAVTRGSGEGVVVATGMKTQLGEISSLVEEAEEEVTPLEKRLNRLGHKLIWLTLVIAVVIAISGILTGKDVFLMVETSIALAVAAIPEGLPIVATIALARGMWRMARRNALINKLSAVETLGATNVIFTDKTGTLTENRMTVQRIDVASSTIRISGEGLDVEGEFRSDGELVNPSEDKLLAEALRVGLLCNNASLQKGEEEKPGGAVGDPLEVALLIAGAKSGLKREDLVEDMPEAREEAFDPEVKMMATFHQQNGNYYVAVKGALDALIEACSSVRTEEGEEELDEEAREHWLARSNEMAGEGLRVIALASKIEKGVQADPYQSLTLIGLVGMLDPPRDDVQEAIETSKAAGVRIIMVTGDQPVTARNIARAVGLVEEGDTEVIHGRDIKSSREMSEQEQRQLLGVTVFARVNPKQKLDIIEIHQHHGSIVAMTGDGVNDAPALKKADIGIAMGRRGTQVAREASDMVLRDDAFSTIVAAVEQGRTIFDNIRKFILYLLSCNMSEIMAVSIAALARIPLPILPLQILFLNLVTDVFPALALGVGEGDPSVMNRAPRDPQESILTRQHWLRITGYGLVITISVLGALALALSWLGMRERQAVTVSFLTLAFAQLWHVFNMRERKTGIIRNDVTGNPYIWGALTLCTALLLAAVYVPGLSGVLHVVNPGSEGWMLILGMSLLPLIVGQVWKSLVSR